MGGTTFYTTGKGRTCQEAFDNAHRDAQFEYGHGGYTGTIAEKNGYVEMPAVPGISALQMHQALTSCAYDDEPKAPTRIAHYKRAVTVQMYETWRCEIPLKGRVPTAPPDDGPRWGHNFDVHGATVIQTGKYAPKKWEVVNITEPTPETLEQYKVNQKLTSIPNFKRFAEIHDDKWGSCIAYKIGDGEWAFFGWASC